MLEQNDACRIMKIYNYKIDLDHLSADEFDDYLAKGWYRMYQDMFTVTHWLSHDDYKVDRVWWLRFNVHKILSHRSHRKILKRANEFTVKYEKYDSVSDEDELLFQKYNSSTNFEGYQSLKQCLYRKEENQEIFNTWSVTVSHHDQIIARGIIDLGETSVLAKVNFFYPVYKKYSMGKFLMLKTLEFMQERGLEWYYPGYIIVGRPKFDYKLFLGKDSAEYYDPEIEAWRKYCDEIMKPEVRTEEEKNLLENVYFRFFY
jgi:arginine-tRNA-protein transferase